MNCRKCGQPNIAGSKYCTKCGSLLETRVTIDRKMVEGPRKELIKVIQTRVSTDEVVSRGWIAAMIFVYIALFVTALVTGFSIVGDIADRNAGELAQQRIFNELKDDLWLSAILNTIFYSLGAALAYVLVSRLKRHYERDAGLRTSLLSFVSSAASTPELKKMAEFELIDMNETNNRINSTEARRNPVVWALIVASPLMVSMVQWYFVFTTESYSDYQRQSIFLSILSLLLYIPLFDLSFFLGRSIHSHHERWMSFATSTSSALRKLGFKETSSYLVLPVESRPYWIYTLVTIITLGMFMFYWWYTLIVDPNRHLRTQWEFENSLIEVTG